MPIFILESARNNNNNNNNKAIYIYWPQCVDSARLRHYNRINRVGVRNE